MLRTFLLVVDASLNNILVVLSTGINNLPANAECAEYVGMCADLEHNRARFIHAYEELRQFCGKLK